MKQSLVSSGKGQYLRCWLSSQRSGSRQFPATFAPQTVEVKISNQSTQRHKCSRHTTVPSLWELWKLVSPTGDSSRSDCHSHVVDAAAVTFRLGNNHQASSFRFWLVGVEESNRRRCLNWEQKSMEGRLVVDWMCCHHLSLRRSVAFHLSKLPLESWDCSLSSVPLHIL